MAASIKFLKAPSKWRKLMLSPKICIKSFVRTILSANKLGVNFYETQQRYTRDQVGDYKEKFLTKIAQHVGENKEKAILTEDIKTLIFLAETQEHFNLVITAYNSYLEKKQMDPVPRPFYFAPLIMHMFHQHQQVDLAKDVLLKQVSDDPKSDFGTVRCVRLLMDLLYKEKRYSEIVNLWHLCDNPLDIGYHIDIESYVFVSLYLLDTKEALEKCMEIISRHPRWKLLESPKCFTCTTMLALDQNAPEIAMEIMSSSLFSRTSESEMAVNARRVDPMRNLHLQNLKMLTYLKLDRVEEAMNILSSLAATSIQHTQRKYFIFITTMEAFDEKMLAHDNLDLKNKYLHLRQSLDRAGLINAQTIRDYIIKPMHGRMDSKRPRSHATRSRYNRLPQNEPAHQIT